MVMNKPNIVLVFMDDMGYGDMGCFSNTPIKTPNMDSVAANGVKFTDMYAPAPICTPSRCGLLTGRYPQRVGLPRVLFPEDSEGLTNTEVTIADCLKVQGYVTCAIGKWHLGCRPEHHPNRHGFDYFFGLPYSNDMEPLPLYENEDVIEEPAHQASLTRRYTDKAIEFIERHQDEPFFVYLAHTMPHIPLHVEEEFRGKSAAGTYGDTIECIDWHIGRLLQRLKDLDLIDNTLFIVTSDNGPWFEGSTGGLRGRKFEVYEGGVRMPFVAQWPGQIPAGTVCQEPASFLDLLPTFVHLAGGEVPGDRVIDGKDIWPLFLGKGKSPHSALYFYAINSLNAVRVGKWKLHVARGFKGEDRKEMPQLFDLSVDAGESYNLADRHPDLVKQLIKMIESFDREIKRERPTES